MENFLSSVLFILVLGSAVSGVPFPDHVETNNIPSESEFIKGIDQCVLKSDTNEITSCATERLVRSLDQLSSQQNLEILPGVSFLSDGSASNYRSGKELKERIEEARSSDGSMLELIGNATARLFAGRTLKVKLPDGETVGRAIEEARKKIGGFGGGKQKNKGGSMTKGLMAFGGILAATLPLFMGKVALIAASALVIGKIALVLGAILLFQMFMKKGNHGWDNSWSAAPAATYYSAPASSYGPPASSYGPPSTAYGVPSAQYPYSRSLNVDGNDAKYSQEMAYSAQK